MASTYLEAKPFEEVENYSARTIIKESLKTVGIRADIEGHVAEIIGPLTARERWELLNEAHFPKRVRDKVKTLGAAWEVAFTLTEAALGWGYPADLLLLQFTGVDQIQVDGFDNPQVSAAMEQLLIKQE